MVATRNETPCRDMHGTLTGSAFPRWPCFCVGCDIHLEVFHKLTILCTKIFSTTAQRLCFKNGFCLWRHYAARDQCRSVYFARNIRILLWQYLPSFLCEPIRLMFSSRDGHVPRFYRFYILKEVLGALLHGLLPPVWLSGCFSLTETSRLALVVIAL